MPPKKAAVKAASSVPSNKTSRAPRSKEAAPALEPAPRKRKVSNVAAVEEGPQVKKLKAETTKSKPAERKIAPLKKATPAIVKKAVVPKKEAKAAAAPKKAPAKKSAPTKAAAKAAPVEKAPVQQAPVQKPAAKVVPAKKTLPQINSRSTQKLDIYVFGEGTAGELGLGGVRYDGKKPIDVTRPRLNPRLSAKDIGVVQMAVGGMHCAALTYDNKILTWGVNDSGALGRRTDAAKEKEIVQKDNSDSDDSDDEEEEDFLNPSESEPRAVDPKYFPEGTEFAFLSASDSATFAVTTEGLVYGWGNFRGNDGDLGFRPKKFRSELEDEEYEGESAEEQKKRLTGDPYQRSPIHIPELKRIVSMTCGTNHALALDDKGKAFVWGAGEQNQLARRVVARTAGGALIPREFGLQRKKIIKIGTGDYHSFAVDKDGKVYGWGLNTFSQTGIPTSENKDDTIPVPSLVKNLEPYNVKEIDGGAHHTICCTESGQVLVWGRIDNDQGGMEVDDYAESDVFIDELGRRRYLSKPVLHPELDGETVASFADGCLVITKEGQAYSWGFSGNYQTGQGQTDDITEATLVDNSAVRGKKLMYAGAGGQFGVLAAVHED